MARPVRYAVQIGAVDAEGASDATLYREAVGDARRAQELGYEAVWLVEHHFSDYYPTPNPLMLLSHIAAACPGLGLGTAVMVLPWYDPIRFAEDVSMLRTLTDGPLHIGMGRGTAKLEYDAMRVPMTWARPKTSPSARMPTAIESTTSSVRSLLEARSRQTLRQLMLILRLPCRLLSNSRAAACSPRSARCSRRASG